MSFAYALTFFCDALLYYGAIGCMGLLGACPANLYWAPVILLAACWLSGRWTGRGKPWLRWLPTAAAIPAMLVISNWPGRLATLPMAAYLPLYIYNNRRAPDYDYAADRFRHSLIGMGVALFLGALFRAASWKRGLPYLFLYFTLNMTLLRLLRHDDRVARSRRFRVLNLAGVALVCAAGFALSQPAVIAAVRVAWNWFLENIVVNLLTALAFVLQYLLYALAWLITRIFGEGAMGIDAPPDPLSTEGGQSLLPRSPAEVRMLPVWVQWAVKGIGIALLAVLAFVILRALSRRVSRTSTDSGNDERESLDAEAPREPRRLLRRRDPQQGVRRWYRRALALIRARNGRVAPTMNTLQIQQENAETVDYDAMDALRELYLPVRYGGHEATREDVARAKEAYERLRKARD